MTNGLDWTRMEAASGIAGSTTPEQEGSFVCLNEREVDWFIRINNTGGPVDVWAVHGIDESDLVESPEGCYYLTRLVPSECLELIRQDVPPSPEDRRRG
jgi:hypothetical protein